MCNSSSLDYKSKFHIFFLVGVFFLFSFLAHANPIFADDSSCVDTAGKPAREGKGCGQKSVNGGIVNLICRAGKCSEGDTYKDPNKSAEKLDQDTTKKSASEALKGTIPADEDVFAPKSELSGGIPSDKSSGILPDSQTSGPTDKPTSGFSKSYNPDDVAAAYRDKPVNVVSTKVDNTPSPGTAAYNTQQAALREMSAEPPSRTSPFLGNNKPYTVVPVRAISIFDSFAAPAVFSTMSADVPSVSSLSSFSGGSSGFSSGGYGGSFTGGSGGGYGYQVSTGFGASGGNWGVSPQMAYSDFGFSSCSSGSCIVSGQGAVVQPVVVAQGGLSPAQQILADTKAAMQAQTNAQNAGTIGNYLADGTPAPQTFGQYVAQGLNTAWEGTKSAFEAVSDAFITPAAAEPAPSAENDSWTGAFSDNTTYSPPESSVPTSDLPGIANGVLPSADVPGIISPPAATYIPADTAQQAQLPDYTSSAFKEATLPDYAQGLRNTQMAPVTEAASPFGIPRAVETVNPPMSGITVQVDRSGVPVPNVASADTGRGPFDGLNNLASQGFNKLPDANFPGGSDSANTRMPVNPGDMSGIPDISRTGAPAAPNAAPGAQESSGQGGMGDIAGMLKSLMGMMKGGGGGSQQSSAPPVTAASSTILATPVPATQFVPPAPLTPAPQVSLIANPNPVEKNTSSIISWTSVWQQEQPATTTRECAVINAAGNTLTDHASTTGSYETQTLSRATYFLVGCKQTGGKLGSAQVLVEVKGDTQAPLVPAKDALDYESTSGVSTAASDLSRALNPAPQNQPSQQVEVACDPNSQSYFDCLTGKMQFVDKLF